MSRPSKSIRPLVALAVLAACAVAAQTTRAFEIYSPDGGTTNCGFCHGDFRSNRYVSPGDGQTWGNLHDLHRFTMLNGDCATCHGADGFTPVELFRSEGGDGLEPLGCVGCHGRAEDDGPANPSFYSGYGAGLRQHHYNADVFICAGCHDDADPGLYTPVGEAILPPYYANPGNGHPAIPSSTCDGTEDFAGDANGLDNDGDGLYDPGDPSCAVPVRPYTWGQVKALYRALR
jgi:hypothetical protein